MLSFKHLRSKGEIDCKRALICILVNVVLSKFTFYPYTVLTKASGESIKFLTLFNNLNPGIIPIVVNKLLDIVNKVVNKTITGTLWLYPAPKDANLSP